MHDQFSEVWHFLNHGHPLCDQTCTKCGSHTKTVDAWYDSKQCEPNRVKERVPAVDTVSPTRLQLNQIAAPVLLLKQAVSVEMEARP